MGAGFGIYVHWPFCRAKCPYCDFNSHVRAEIDEAHWQRALLAEIDHFAALTPGRTVETVFFGGGTPSLMAPATAAAVLDRIAERWATAPDLEVTLEANPTSVEASKFADLARAGVNRVSLGVQALNDADLKFLGRQHDAGEALAAVAIARRHFARHSIDLIYARPGQSVAAWLAELERALDHVGEHISVYQLTIEPGTAFHARHLRGEIDIPDEDLGAELYEATQARLEAAGLAAYEISNHARPGAACRHNLIYWRGGDWVGVGPGAHGRLTLDGVRQGYKQFRAPDTWLAAVDKAGHGTDEALPIVRDEAAEELLMMGLRLDEGVDAARFAELSGRPLAAWIDPTRRAALEEEALIEPTARGLRATPAGRQRLDAVLRYLLA